MADEAKPIRILLINGSVRPGNYTSMASALVVDELRKDPKVRVATTIAATGEKRERECMTLF